jgi:predicted GNAT superfamily acetyltransferase
VTAAEAAARDACVRIAEVNEPDELEHMSRLLSVVWNGEPAQRQITPDLLRALAKTGNYVAACYSGDDLIGAAVAFFGSPAEGSLHSHITGIARPYQARHAGFALKLHQRAWALARGVERVTWTFDPLIRRNAHFNIGKLRVRVLEYLPNFYGEMSDRINAGDESDRILVEWPLLEPGIGSRDSADGPDPLPSLLDVDAAGRPVRRSEAFARALVRVPPDIERLRVENPQVAREWRMALRAALSDALTGDGRVSGFRAEAGYVVDLGGRR